MTTIETNKAVVAAYVKAMNEGDEAGLRAVFAPGARIEGVTGAGSVEDAMPIWRQLHHGLNMHLEVKAMAAEADIVGVRYVERGRWVGPFLDLGTPTNLPYELDAMEWFEVRDGKITNRWGARDAAAQARQVGFAKAAGKGDMQKAGKAA